MSLYCLLFLSKLISLLNTKDFLQIVRWERKSASRPSRPTVQPNMLSSHNHCPLISPPDHFRLEVVIPIQGRSGKERSPSFCYSPVFSVKSSLAMFPHSPGVECGDCAGWRWRAGALLATAAVAGERRDGWCGRCRCDTPLPAPARTLDDSGETQTPQWLTRAATEHTALHSDRLTCARCSKSQIAFNALTNLTVAIIQSTK